MPPPRERPPKRREKYRPARQRAEPLDQPEDFDQLVGVEVIEEETEPEHMRRYREYREEYERRERESWEGAETYSEAVTWTPERIINLRPDLRPEDTQPEGSPVWQLSDFLRFNLAGVPEYSRSLVDDEYLDMLYEDVYLIGNDEITGQDRVNIRSRAGIILAAYDAGGHEITRKQRNQLTALALGTEEEQTKAINKVRDRRMKTRDFHPRSRHAPRDVRFEGYAADLDAAERLRESRYTITGWERIQRERAEHTYFGSKSWELD